MSYDDQREDHRFNDMQADTRDADLHDFADRLDRMTARAVAAEAALAHPYVARALAVLEAVDNEPDDDLTGTHGDYVEEVLAQAHNTIFARLRAIKAPQ